MTTRYKRLAVMRNSLKKLQAWRSRRSQRRSQRALEQWEQIRTHGKARFVLRVALTVGLTMVGLNDVYRHVYGESAISVAMLFCYLLAGIVGAHRGWNEMERKYKDALIEARVKASPTGELPPHNSPLRITPDSQ